MKLRPVKKSRQPEYPSKAACSAGLKALFTTLAAGGSAALLPDLQADEPAAVDAKKPSLEKKADATKMADGMKAALVKIKKEIDTTSADLGSDNFKKRRAASRRLIAIGLIKETVDDPEKKGKKKAITPYREAVLEKMQTLRTHNDPEVSQRAKDIITAITPKRPPKRAFRTGGVIVNDAW